jgi:hypothetical protein
MIRIYERTSISRHTFSSIGTNSTGGGEMDLVGTDSRAQKFHSGILQGVSVSCDSDDFDVSIRTHSNALPNTPSEVYDVEGVNLYRNDSNLGVGWINRDTPQAGKLYLVLVNNDGVNATGEILVEVMTNVPKRFSRNR